jgi:WD40 repeat protein
MGLSHAAFSPDGQRIVTASADHTAQVWNAGTGQLLAKLEGHTDEVLQAVFSPDGRRILTAIADHTARVYRVITLQELARISTTLRSPATTIMVTISKTAPEETV